MNLRQNRILSHISQRNEANLARRVWKMNSKCVRNIIGSWNLSYDHNYTYIYSYLKIWELDSNLRSQQSHNDNSHVYEKVCRKIVCSQLSSNTKTYKRWPQITAMAHSQIDTFRNVVLENRDGNFTVLISLPPRSSTITIQSCMNDHNNMKMTQMHAAEKFGPAMKKTVQNKSNSR